MNLYCEELGGTRKRQPTSRFVVSRWYVPGGCEYDKAVLVNIFFDTEANANKYAQQYEMPPEIATLVTIALHTDIRNRVLRESLSRAVYYHRLYVKAKKAGFTMAADEYLADYKNLMQSTREYYEEER